MTTEEKDLLLRDLSARLPYGVKFFGYKVSYSDNVLYYDNEKLVGIVANSIISEKDSFDINRVRLYLRPMSSMTDEERAERSSILWELEGHIEEDVTYKYQDWLNTHHFDYRDLIEKGLAIEVTEENNPYGNLV